jgi:hypothetical protein
MEQVEQTAKETLAACGAGLKLAIHLAQDSHAKKQHRPLTDSGLQLQLYHGNVHLGLLRRPGALFDFESLLPSQPNPQPNSGSLLAED